MPCFFPLHGYYSRALRKMFFGCIPHDVIAQYHDSFEEMSVPCGRCVGCRLERSRQWAIRCVHEASLHEENSFLTLTYSPENLPSNGSLVKHDLTLFFKRLRKAYSDKKLRYFACGEYGEQFDRPHYHVILFGLDPRVERKKLCLVKPLSPVALSLSPLQSLLSPLPLFGGLQNVLDVSDVKVTYSPEIEKIWQKGHVFVGSVSFESCAYVARYCLKKINGKAAAEHYQGRQPEYVVMSRRPGIGGDWFESYKGDVFPADAVFARGYQCKPPRYYDEKLREYDEELFELIKSRRTVAAKDNEISVERLAVMHEVAKLNQEKISRKYEKNG